MNNDSEAHDDKPTELDLVYSDLERATARIEKLDEDILDRESLLRAAGKRLADVDTAMVNAMALIKLQGARIEELEATLREIAGGCLSSGNSWKTMRELARAALDKDAGE